MGLHAFDPTEKEKRLNELREYLRKDAQNLSAEEEGKYLTEIDKLKQQLEFAKLFQEVEKSNPITYSSFVLEMKIKSSGSK